MFRVSVLVLGLAFCCMGYGCACCQQEPPVERTPQPAPRPAAQSEALAAALLFDRTPGPYDASEFTLRSDWPSTESFYSFGQVVYSREQLIDVQGPNGGGFTYQQFDTERVAIGFR
jgi:hypothetical protein